jgi:hypothetical protein
MLKPLAATAAFFALAGVALAQDYQFVTGLADILAAEEFCGLTYDQDAVSQLINERVAADDLGFTDLLKNMTYMAELRQDEFTRSATTAHCVQIERLAAGFGFVD